jgi:chemotaxis protein methyltransferase CheR
MHEGGSIESIELALFVEAVHRRYGYDLRHYASAFLDRRIMAFLARSGSSHLGELQHRVLRDADLFVELLEDLSVTVTEMFRDADFFRAFRTVVVPLLRTYPLLRIWHGGCATGEEVYTTAIVLHEEGLYERAQIYATDLSARSVAKAKEGVYAADRLPAFTEAYRAAGGNADLASYYTEGYGAFAMKEWLRRNVLFFQHDLIADQVFAETHVVLCRNVLIYFDAALKHRVVAKLTESLRPGGVLCLGSAERLNARDMALGYRELVPDARIYRYEHTPD